MFKISPKMTKINPKNVENQDKLTQKYPKSAQVTSKNAGLSVKILLMVLKPTGQLLPSFPHNFHLWGNVVSRNIDFM